MFKLGLTGSIGMGKSTTAKLFQDAGCAVWDADAAVHRLYSKGGAAVPLLATSLPEAVEDEAISRDRLKVLLSDNPANLKIIETIVHPLVRKDRQDFEKSTTARIAVFDIPLLFETGSQDQFDAVACVYIDAETQKHRVMDRGTMTEAQFQLILSKQMPIDEKLAKSDYAIKTDTLSNARAQVQTIIADINRKTHHA